MNGTPLLRTFFDTTLQERLEVLEAKRSDYAMKNMIGAIAMFTTIGAAILIFRSEIHPAILIFLIPPFAWAIYLHVKANKLWNEYKDEFKEKIVKSIVRFIDPVWEYRARSYIPEGTYQVSEIFQQEHDSYFGEDLIRGKIDKTDFECSEVFTEYKKSTGDDDKWETIFNGLFFHSDFHKHFSGKTFVVPDHSEQLLGRWVRKLQSWNRSEPLIEMENPDFERAFTVHSTDPIEARYILTPTIMETMLILHEKYGDIYFSFVDSRVF